MSSRKVIAIKRFNPKTGEVTVEKPLNLEEKFLVAQKSADDPSPVKKQKFEAPPAPVEEAPKTNGLFGNNSATPLGSLFGSSSPATTSFGSKPITSAPPLGNSSPAQPTFGGKPITGAPPLEQFKPPNQSVFGQSKPSGSLFGNKTETTAPSGGLFGGAKPSGTLFGNKAPEAQAQGGLFGGKSTEAPAQGGLFGKKQEEAPASGLFDNKSAEAPPASGGLFGNSSSTPGQGGSLFGNQGSAAPSQGGLFGASTPAQGGSLFGPPNNAAGGGLFGAQPAQGGLFANSNSIFGNPQGNIFKKDDTPENEDSEADYAPDADEPPTVTLGSDIVVQKSPFTKIFEITVEKFKIATPVSQKKNLQNGRLSIHRGEFDKTIMCKIIFQNNIGKNLYEANISAICKFRRVTEKVQKNQLKIAAIKVNAETKKLEMQYCLINFTREDDIKNFEKHYQEVIDELKKVGAENKK